MFDLGIQELIVIFIVALIVFGPKRLPELGKTIGKGILELKKAVQGVKEQVDAEFNTIQKTADVEHTLKPPESKENGNNINIEKEIPQTATDKERKEDKVDD